MRATFRRHRRRGGGDPSLQAAAALTLAASDIARAVEDGLYRSSAGRPAITTEVSTGGHGAHLVLTARHRELGAAAEQVKAAIVRILRAAWLAAGAGSNHSGGPTRGD